MPLITETATPGMISSVVAAAPGWRVSATAPAGTDISKVPTPSDVVGWALLASDAEPGGAVVVPVFLADGRTWTPDQFRAAYGAAIDITVTRAS